MQAELWGDWDAASVVEALSVSHIVALLERRLFELPGENVPGRPRLSRRPWEWIFLVVGVRFKRWDPGASRGAPVEVRLLVCVHWPAV